MSSKARLNLRLLRCWKPWRRSEKPPRSHVSATAYTENSAQSLRASHELERFAPHVDNASRYYPARPVCGDDATPKPASPHLHRGGQRMPVCMHVLCNLAFLAAQVSGKTDSADLGRNQISLPRVRL